MVFAPRNCTAGKATACPTRPLWARSGRRRGGSRQRCADVAAGDGCDRAVWQGFAQFACAPQKFVTPIPEGIPFELALGEPLACVLSGARRARIDMGDTVAVIGLGFMGLLTLQAIRLRGPARLIAINPGRRPWQWHGASAPTKR